MKVADVMLSALLHAGIIAGVTYGISHYGNDPQDDEIFEPTFFEMLEESVIAAASAPMKPDEQETPPEPLPSNPPQKPEDPDPMPKQEPAPEPAPEALETVKENNPPKPETVPPEPLPSHPPPQPEESDPMPPETSPSPPEQAAEPEIAPQADQEVAKVVSEPAAIGRIVPKYPRSARRRGREGTVTLEILVSDSGKVSDTAVVSGSGHRDLDEAAVSAVRSAQFDPATEDGVKVEGLVRLTFEFKLR